MLIPGIGGSQLFDGDNQIWPIDELRDLRPAFLLSVPARVGRFLESYQTIGKPTWRPILDLLHELGYVEDQDLFRFAFDWRKSVRETATLLKAQIETWARQRPQGQADGKFLLIAHSFGTLVARWYVDQLEGNQRVAHMMLIAAVDQGAPCAVLPLVTGSFETVEQTAPPILVGLTRFEHQETLRALRNTPAMYDLLPAEPIIEDAHATPLKVEELLKSDHPPVMTGVEGKVLATLAGPPSVPSTYVYGTGYSTAASYFRKDEHRLDLAINYGGGDGVALARRPRPEDIEMGVDVRPTRGKHLEILQAQDTLNTIRRLASRLGHHEDTSLGERWYQAIVNDPSYVAASTRTLPLLLPIPGADSTASPMRQVISHAGGHSRILLLGEEAADAVPALLGWLATERAARGGVALPLLADFSCSSLPREPMAMLEAALRKGLSSLLGPLGEGEDVLGLLRSNSPYLIATGIDALHRHPGAEGLKAAVQAWVDERDFANVRWILVDPSRETGTLFSNTRVLASLDVRRELQVACCAWRTNGTINLEVAVGELPSSPETMLRFDRIWTAPMLPLSSVVDPYTGKLNDPHIVVSVGRPGSDTETQTGNVTLNTSSRYGMLEFALKRDEFPGPELELCLVVDGTVRQRTLLRLDDLLAGSPLGSVWIDRIVKVAVEGGLADQAKLDEIDREIGLNTRSDVAGAEARIRQRLNDLGSSTTGADRRDRRNNAILLLSWLNAAQARMGACQQRWVLRQAADELRLYLGVAHPGVITSLQDVIDGDDRVSVSWVQNALTAIKMVGRVDVPPFQQDQPSSGMAHGTGWLLTPDLLLTCRHVIADQEFGAAARDRLALEKQARGTTVLFDFDAQGAPGVTVPVLKLEAYGDKLDYAVLRLAQPQDRPRLSRCDGELTIAAGVLENVNIVQHPQGGLKMLAIRTNRARSSTETEIRYDADTDPGSSGAPIFNDRWQIVGMHRASRSLAQSQTNIGIQLHAICQDLESKHNAIWIEINSQPDTP